MLGKVKIVVICGTSREGRLSYTAAQWVAESGRKRSDCEIIFVDPRDFAMPGDSNNPETRNQQYADIVAKADAFYIVTPEYNHSFPSSLKRLLDSEFAAYWHKPIATAGVSNGSWGGVRACEALLPVYHTMGLVAVKPELYFPRVQELFLNSGDLKPEHLDRYLSNVNKAYDELIWFAQRLKD